MNIGLMRERVSLQAPQELRSPTGEATLAWATEATVWGSVDGLSSRDVLQAQQANVIASHKVIIRHRDGVNPQYRLLWRGKTLEIVSVSPRDNRTRLELLVNEVQ
ncbi:MAG: head-tail adaptor protein [Caulobacteraceae bacterium]|nr:head-tail adaptor protein [Caulobacteraceae bacterium]